MDFVALFFTIGVMAAILGSLWIVDKATDVGPIWLRFLVGFLIILICLYAIMTDFFQVSPCQKVELMALETVKSNQNNLLGAFGTLGLEFGANLLGANLGDGTIARLGAMEEYPNLPPQVGCSIGVYQIWLHS